MNELTHIFSHHIGPKNKGGIGVSAWHRRGDSFIYICTAICSPQDQYSKKVAVKMLTENQIAGHSIRLPIHTSGVKDMTYRELRDIVNSWFE